MKVGEFVCCVAILIVIWITGFTVGYNTGNVKVPVEEVQEIEVQEVDLSDVYKKIDTLSSRVRDVENRLRNAEYDISFMDGCIDGIVDGLKDIMNR